MSDRRRWDSGPFLVPVVVILILLLGGLLFMLRQRPSVQEKERVEEIYMPGYPLYSEDVQRIPVQLFFLDRGLLLKAENREIYNSKEMVNRLRQVMILLLQGPRSQDLFPVFPDGLRLRELYLHDGCAYIDLKVTPAIKRNTGTFMEYLTVTSIQDSLMKNFPEVEKVKIVLNGQETETLFGHIDIRLPIGNLVTGDKDESSDRNF